ncbi:Na+/H+ antiporter NhaC family protein [Sulfurimonas sp. NWX79]|uniref:Na+/H+ antiporter NhaC family protein n=1 Tax=Sulfurimonas sp. NWX79 TaxID=2925412 RepID=UPI003204E51E
MAIALALYSRNVLLSLFGGVFLGLFLLQDFSFFATLDATLSLFISLLSEAWIGKTLVFAVLVGSVMELIERSGGINGFVEYMTQKSKLVASPRSALMVSYIIGVVIFIESSITSLIAGAVGRPLCDKEGVPHAKLAYICDSTSAPISSLIVLNGWGALLLGLIATQIDSGLISGESVDWLIKSVVYNFYAISALIVTFLVIWFNIDIGPMKAALPSNSHARLMFNKSAPMHYMIMPIIVMIVSVFVFLYLTGNGNILKGSGSSSIFYTMLTTLGFMYILYVMKGKMSTKIYLLSSFKGAKKLFGIAMILLFAFAIGKVTLQLHTGLYLASLASNNLSPYLLAAVIFLLSSIISFSTGTSWGTFSIMIPIAVPMAVGLDANVSLAIGAVISGGVFGDHCSPISDTTIISSLASDCEVIEHVKTQLPYALISGVVAIILFIVFAIFA